MDWTSPAVIALHRSLVEITVRLGRCEDKLGLADEPHALATFTHHHVPPPCEPCSCDESVALRARVRDLETAVNLLGGLP